jgi:uncharacterized membrane protein (DUF4010 family)
MKDRIAQRLAAFALCVSCAQPAAAGSTGDVPASTPIDWGQAFRVSLIAAGLWIIANLIGRLWIRARNFRTKRPEE